MIKKRILFILILCLIFVVPIASAETLTGTLGESGISSNLYNATSWVAGGSPPTYRLQYLWAHDIENTQNPFSTVRFQAGTQVSNFINTSAPPTANTPVEVRQTSCSGRLIGTGTIGYQRTFNSATPPVETPYGFEYIIYNNDWNVSGLSGDYLLYLCYNYDAIWQVSVGLLANPTTTPHNSLSIAGNSFNSGQVVVGAGQDLFNRYTTVYSEYSVTKPSGLGIAGSINKNVGGTAYNSRMFITDSSDTVLTSDTASNANTFNFTVTASQIKVKMYAPSGSWYNTTTLFSAPVTPTPTVTPTTTGTTTTPADESNITIAVKYVNNDTAVVNAYVEMQGYYKSANKQGSWQQSLQGYTDSNGYFQSDLTDIKNFDWKVVVQKAGLQTNSEWLDNINPYSYARVIYMYPDTTGTGGIPTSINYTLQIKNSQTGANVVGALVTLKDDIAGTAQRSVLSNATGYAVFKSVPNTAYVDGSISASNYQSRTWSIEVDSSTGTYIQSKDYARTLYIAPVGISPTGTVTPYPTPTPTPIATDSLILTASPDSINLGQTVTLTGSSSNVTKLTYAGGLRRTIFMVNKHPQSYPFDYHEIGMFENVNATYWKFRTTYDSAWNTPTTASPLVTTNVPDTNGLYTYAFIGYETIAGSAGAINTAGTDDVLVGGGAGGGSLTMVLSAQDGKTTSHLMNYQMNITDDNSGVVTEFGNVSYEKQLSLLRGNSYTLRASKENYESNSETFIVPTSPAIVAGTFGAIAVVKLYPSGWISAGNTSVSVRGYDAETYYPLPNVQINIAGYPTQYTGSESESASFSIPQNTPYTVIASKTGYCSVTESKNTGTADYQLVSMFLKYGACTGTTPTPTPTGTPTVTPTQIGGYGNLTGEAMVCGVLPEGATVVDILKNSLACNGLETKESQNLGLAMLIMLFGGIILGRVAKGIGVLAGVIAGAVIAMAMGFLPFWIIIVVIIIAGLVFASKVFWSSGG